LIRARVTLESDHVTAVTYWTTYWDKQLMWF